MQGLVTDRTQQNVLRRNTLAAKGWSGMTAEEKAEWIGSPLDSPGANLIPYAPYYSDTVKLTFTDDSIIATTLKEGIYSYAVLILGAAKDFEGRTVTLSADDVRCEDGATGSSVATASLYWHDSGGYNAVESIDSSISREGAKTFALTGNTKNRAYLAMYIYAATYNTRPAGWSVIYKGIKLEFGDTRTEFAPYVEIIPNDTTKGAYNYSDLNRVERAAERLSILHGLNLDTKTDWSAWDIPTQSDMSRYLLNIRKIRQACMNPNTVAPAPESMNNLTYNDANNIEKILIAAHENSDRIYRMGELFAGEV